MNRKKIRSALLLLIGFILIPGVTYAQSGIVVKLTPPNTESFPFITFFVEISDENGRRIPNIPSTSFGLLENEVEIPDLVVEEVEVGAQEIFVINTDLDMRIRDSLGNTRFDLVRNALIDWWSRPDASTLGLDELSLQTSDGVLINRGSSSAELATALDDHTPVFEDQDLAYDLLFTSLDLADVPDSISGMPTFLFFATSLPRAPRDIPVENIISRAQGADVRIYPILIGPPEAAEQVEAEFLNQIADETGGKLIVFDETKGLGELADLVADQRTRYQLTYRSEVDNSGPHQVQVRLSGRDLELLSNPETFTIDIQPPEVVLIQPPRTILRVLENPGDSLENLYPRTVEIPVIVNFPDTYERPLQQSRLFVDGILVDQLDEPPFDVLTWDIDSFREDGDHSIAVSVIDSLGIEGSSDAFPISLTVEQPSSNLVTLRPALGSLLIAVTVLVAGVIAATILITIGRRRERVEEPSEKPPRRFRVLRRAGLQSGKDPLPIEAMLVELDQDTDNGNIIPLTGVDTIIGSDPSLAAVPIDDPSIEGLHARLVRQVDGDYRIRDQYSTAGTWVNYEVLPEEGKQLEHGDVIHFGNVAFRFELTTPPPPRRIQISPSEDSDDDATIVSEVTT